MYRTTGNEYSHSLIDQLLLPYPHFKKMPIRPTVWTIKLIHSYTWQEPYIKSGNLLHKLNAGILLTLDITLLRNIKIKLIQCCFCNQSPASVKEPLHDFKANNTSTQWQFLSTYCMHKCVHIIHVLYVCIHPLQRILRSCKQGIQFRLLYHIRMYVHN